MQRRTFLATSAAIVAGCAGPGRLSPQPGPQRGIAFDGYGGNPGPDDFAAMSNLGATHVALFSYAYMDRHTAPEVRRFVGTGVDRSLTDEGLLAMGTMAKNAGLRVLVLPTLDDFRDGYWRGEVRMHSEQEWRLWWGSYRLFVLHYARLAREIGAVGFSVGTELRETAHREAEWRDTISMVREVFPGWITYAANWDDYDRVPWWDAVDLIGIQAYFELGDPGTAPPAERRARLGAAWQPIKQRLASLSEDTGKRIAFTEIGYKSHSGATAFPWKWEIEGVQDISLQSAAYEAAFEAFWNEPWFAGFYWWKWRPAGALGRDYERDFQPQGKPAEAVLRRHYRS